jgi:SAM-dependent methyltransferase
MLLKKLSKIRNDFRRDKKEGGSFRNTLARKAVLSTYHKRYELWVLKPYYRKGQVLNVGAGVDKLGPNVLNLDVTDSEDNYLGTVPTPDVIGDMHNLEFSDNSFDCVVAMHVLEHSHNPKLALSEMIRVTKKDGFICGCQPNFYRRNFVAYYHRNPTHLARWTDLDFVAWLSQSGFLGSTNLVQFRKMKYFLNPYSFDWVLLKK